MSLAMLAAVPCSYAAVEPVTEQRQVSAKSQRKNSTAGFGAKKREPLWQCVKNCGACCKLDKGPNFPSPEEIFDDSSDIQLYKSLVGSDGWCIHFEKSTRTCSIYSDRPYFCRVEADVFETLYGIDKKKFNKEACSSCIDTIKVVHGSESKELEKFKKAIRS
ncbi:uncharacterized protein LOC112522169 isoform X2 [Cynara cardunculus var. scolymus]|uniref:uncharacterized protein LOC112522169 isoform X2 n=1 Tax=Cynara cardunculus var. scolymus TaxID=59895 RepID=UPI000D627E82|nr:uncharacterized protein LOC112522169 isoform X2 [Cynara cardunculus var. scolymus]